MSKVMLLAGSRQKSESYKAIQACNDYLRLGPGRTLPALVQIYTKGSEKQPPTRSYGTLKKWAATYHWRDRGAEYDVGRERQKNEYARQMMMSGLAVPFERVEKLKVLAGFLEGQLYEQDEEGVYHNVWLPDVKQIGAGPNAERVDIERFNAAIISEFRAALGDLAKETGGRVRKAEITGAEGGPIEMKQEPIDLSGLSDSELDALGAILAKLRGCRRPGAGEA